MIVKLWLKLIEFINPIDKYDLMWKFNDISIESEAIYYTVIQLMRILSNVCYLDNNQKLMS